MVVAGLLTRFAQSSGEWPGSRRTFLEGRLAEGRVELVGAREEGAMDERDNGVRRVGAAEGGGRSSPEILGGARRLVLEGVDGAWVSDVEAAYAGGFRFALGLGRGGGGMTALTDVEVDR